MLKRFTRDMPCPVDETLGIFISPNLGRSVGDDIAEGREGVGRQRLDADGEIRLSSSPDSKGGEEAGTAVVGMARHGLARVVRIAGCPANAAAAIRQSSGTIMLFRHVSECV